EEYRHRQSHDALRCHNLRIRAAWGGPLFWATSEQAEHPVIFGEASQQLSERASLAGHWPAAREFCWRPENDRVRGQPGKAGPQRAPPKLGARPTPYQEPRPTGIKAKPPA